MEDDEQVCAVSWQEKEGGGEKHRRQLKAGKQRKLTVEIKQN